MTTSSRSRAEEASGLPPPPLGRRHQWRPLLVSAALLALAAVPLSTTAPDDESEGLGPPPAYDELRAARLEPAGRIRDGRLRVDRVEFELAEGDLYVATVDDHVSIAVYLGDGVVRCYPPDGVEHQQVEKFLDEDYLEEDFDRFVFWFTDDTGDRLRRLADQTPGREINKANELLEDRREELLEQQLENPDSRVLLDLFSARSDVPADPTRSYVYTQIDGDDRGWFSIQIEPRAREEVTIYRFDRGHNVTNVWMGFHALTDFDETVAARAFAGFPRDPETEGQIGSGDDDDWDARDLGLSPRLLAPDREGWTARVAVPRVDVDLALDGGGEAKASAALLVDPQQPLAALRLRISPYLHVTDVRWRPTVPDDAENVHAVSLVDPGDQDAAARQEQTPDPEEPAPPTGEPVHYVQEVHDRRMADDLYEPWVTIALPRAVKARERFVLELSYEGELVERLRSTQDFLLKDTLYWIPTHTDNRRSRMHLTFRVPERYRVASGTTLVHEDVVEDTRIMRWVSANLVRSMSFNYGRFDVTEVDVQDMPPIAVYANRNHRGFAPGNREKTIEDLTESIRTYSEYFGQYPFFRSLLVTETASTGGQAFPGLVLLTFRAFGELLTGEAELFRSHEVAHQWWGSAVDWEDYRDQWISEGFAQYSAALYTLSGQGEEDQFLDMLDAWRLDVLGQVSVGQGVGLKHYGFRPEVIRRSDGNESGPVVAGYRLNSSDTPMDYRLLVYEKGAFILHMIRMMLADLETGNDQRFRELMRQFVDDHLHKVANTRSFEDAVARVFDEDMGWFFDQWVYGVDVPTYRPDLKVSRAVDRSTPYLLHGTIGQEDVPDDFRMPVPILMRFEAHPPIAHRVWVDTDSVEVEIPLPAEPTEIEFNYQHAVLAHVR